MMSLPEQAVLMQSVTELTNVELLHRQPSSEGSQEPKSAEVKQVFAQAVPQDVLSEGSADGLQRSLSRPCVLYEGVRMRKRFCRSSST